MDVGCVVEREEELELVGVVSTGLSMGVSTEGSSLETMGVLEERPGVELGEEGRCAGVSESSDGTVGELCAGLTGLNAGL